MAEQISFGVKACVLIKYSGTIHELGTLLQEKLQISEFYYDTDMDPPHEEYGMGGGMGMDCWLYRSENENLFEFSMSSTESTHHEMLNGNMHDISLWLKSILEIYHFTIL